MKKKKHFTAEPPEVSNISEANALIRELWAKLREYEDRLALSALKDTDTIVRCLPDDGCALCGGHVEPNTTPTYLIRYSNCPKSPWISPNINCFMAAVSVVITPSGLRYPTMRLPDNWGPV
ncbi:DUF6444 domain-containing protein [Xenorhabdus entomophaga]|uniref:DUF6444 domain-containing protein n=1 Tax=Xenorhabdus entomophaga TaxID=3136257 RepID=UPI00069FEA29